MAELVKFSKKGIGKWMELTKEVAQVSGSMAIDGFLKILKQRWPMIEGVLKVLDQVKERVKVILRDAYKLICAKIRQYELYK